MGGFEKKAQREHRTFLLWDETGHSFRARPGTTWARRMMTPVLRRVSKRREVSSIVAMTPDGRLHARHVRTSISSDTVISALRSFRRQIGTPLLVVWDRLNAHRSQVTTAFIAALPQDYAVAYLPAYAPELNPEEQCNAFVKRAMEDALPGSGADLHRLARREFSRLKCRPSRLHQLSGEMLGEVLVHLEHAHPALAAEDGLQLLIGQDLALVLVRGL